MSDLMEEVRQCPVTTRKIPIPFAVSSHLTRCFILLPHCFHTWLCPLRRTCPFMISIAQTDSKFILKIAKKKEGSEMKKGFRQLFREYREKLEIKRKLSVIFRILPLQNRKIVFDNFQGRGYGCDPKYICEELRGRNEKLDLVWLSGSENADVPPDVRNVKYGSMQAMYELSTAHIWVDNVKTAYRPPKRKAQFYLQTWHSALGFKKNEADAAARLPEAYIRTSRRDAGDTDLMYANNDFRLQRYRESYWYNGPVIKCSVPRCAILFNRPPEIEKKVREYFAVPDGTGIVLYAPTFRRDCSLLPYRFDYNKCLEAVRTTFGKGEREYVLLLRLHPKVVAFSEDLDYGERVKNATGYPDMQELLAVSDVLISDYSACIFDFAFVKKPVFLYVPDYRKYVDEDRGVYFTEEEIPFCFSQNEQMLLQNIKNFSKEEYTEKCDRFLKKVGACEDGHGDVYIADLLLNKIHDAEKKR